MQDLNLLKAQLQYEKQLHKKLFEESTVKLSDYFTDTVRNVAFDLGSFLVMRMISGFGKRKNR